MANSMQKDAHVRARVAQTEVVRRLLKACVANQALPHALRYDAGLKLHQLQKTTSATQVVNRCVLSGRARGVLRHFKVSRIWVRLLLAQGLLQGTTKSSW